MNTIANFSPHSQSFYESLRGATVHNPQMEELCIYVAFLCVDILGVDANMVSISSDFNDDLGADSADLESFAQHIGKEVFVPKAFVGMAGKWLNFLKYLADSNEANGTYKFPLDTVKDMANALLSLNPERIEYPR